MQTGAEPVGPYCPQQHLTGFMERQMISEDEIITRHGAGCKAEVWQTSFKVTSFNFSLN